jgi:hypothetical protein
MIVRRFIFVLLAIVFYVPLRFTFSDYPFDIFKPLLDCIVIVLFADIGGFVDHHCLNLLFLSPLFLTPLFGIMDSSFLSISEF